MAKTRTEENIMAAFAGESQARNKYTYFASVARKEGFEQIAAIFEETANNEKEHAKKLFKLLNGIGTTKENLKHAAEGEKYEWGQMYPDFEKVAREEGNAEAAALFHQLAKVEAEHEKRYLALLNNVETNHVFKKEEKVRWVCRNCGHIHEGPEAPKVCPACTHPQAYFEIHAENY